MSDDRADNRKFLRHPSDIPIEVTEVNMPFEGEREKLQDVSLTGLSFVCKNCPEKGSVIRFRIPVVDPVFEIEGRVAWVTKGEEGYRVGVEFLGLNDAFRGRMVEQVCYIEHYRKKLSKERGEEVSSEEAGVDWIKKYAADFPQL